MLKSARIGICALGFLLSGLVAFSQQPQETKIERIDIRGNRRIPEERIRFYIQSYPGDRFDEERLEFDLRALWKSNFFDDIQIHERDGDVGKIVTFVLKEKPLIRALEFVGNSASSESDILDTFKENKIGLSIDSRYAPSKIKAAEQVLKSMLAQSGKPLGTVRSEIEEIPPSSVRVRFVIEEGPTVQIGQIVFVGNKIFSDAELKNALELTKEHGMMTMFKNTDKFHPEKLEMDLGLNLDKFYKSHGYMTVQVGQPVIRILEGPRGTIPLIRKSKQQFYIEIPVDAGDQYRIGTLEYKNCAPLSCDRLVQALGLKSGDIVNFTQIQDALDFTKSAYSELGYINWTYIPEQSFDRENKLYNISFEFDTGQRFLVNRIDFKGNTKTRDKVIRREFLIQEGLTFSSRALEQSVMRLNQIGLFEEIKEEDYEVLPDEKTGLVDISLTVKEKSHQSIGFTGGISGISGSFIGVNYSTNNFMGRGETLDFSLQAGTRTSNFIVSFTEPHFMDSPWNMGISLYSRRYNYDTYAAFGLNTTSGNAVNLFTQKTLGTTVSFNRRIGRSLWSGGIRYSLQRIGIEDIAEGYESYALGQFTGLAANPYDALEGILRSEITPIMSYNSTNAYFNPTRGTSLSLSLGISGGLIGGDFRMLRPRMDMKHFFPDKWLSGGRNVFGFHFMGQYVQSYGTSTGIPFYDRFFIGGENSIRGFDIRSISPLAIISTPRFDQDGNPIIDPRTGLALTTEKLSPIGADTVTVLNFEYRIPIAGPLSVAAFYDVGLARVTRDESLGSYGASTVEIIDSVNNAVRGSTGIEVQFVLPVVSAPFRLIFAVNPQRLDETIYVGNRPYRLSDPGSDIKFTVGRSF